MNENSGLRVMSVNLWNTNKPYMIRMTGLSRLINNIRPDVIAFQEVSPSPLGNSSIQLDDIPALSSYHIKYNYADIWKGREEGLAVASKVRPLDSRVVQLPKQAHQFSDDTEPNRIAQVLYMVVHDYPVFVINTHFSFRPTSTLLRKSQGQRIVREIEVLLDANPESRIIVCGDLNCFESDLQSELLSTEYIRNPWRYRSDYTFSSSNRFADSRLFPNRWIDYILTVNMNFRDCLVHSDLKHPVSDHYPISIFVRPSSHVFKGSGCE